MKNLNSTIKVIGFDLDNTLYDHSDFEFEIFYQISERIEMDFSIPCDLYFESLKKLYKNGIKDNVFNKALKNSNITLPENWENYINNTIIPMYRNFIPSNLKLYKNSLHYLNFFQNNGYKLVLITNGKEKAQNTKIDLLNIRKYFDLILISDMYATPKRKPNTYMFNEVLQRLKIQPNEMIYIGDDIIRDRASDLIGVRFIHIDDLNLIIN